MADPNEILDRLLEAQREANDHLADNYVRMTAHTARALQALRDTPLKAELQERVRKTQGRHDKHLIEDHAAISALVDELRTALEES